ncbi:MAG: hypothetical protein PHR75_07630 [Sulfurovum sp.]|nr:hypothetical protein [Sulfurovum sp.]
MKYDKLYDDLMGMYDALAPRIDEAYGKVSVQSLEFADEPLDANGNPLFVNPSHLGGGVLAGTANAFENADMNGDGIVTAEEFTQAFLLGMAGGTAASKAIALGLKSLNPKLYNSLAGTTEQFRNMAKTNPKLLAELYKTAKDASVNMFAGAKAINANVGKLDDAMKLADDGKS